MNRTRQPKPVSQLLNKSGLQHDMALITKLDSLLQQYLKQHNIHGCRIGNLQNGSLLIEIPSAANSMRLKFMRSELLSLLRQAVPALLKISYRVNPQLAKAPIEVLKKNKIEKKRATKMSKDVANSFIELGELQDDEFKKVLQSLAKFSKKSD